jgi:hypothetical protein
MRLPALLLTLCLAPLARAEPTGVRYHGAGGPFLSGIALFATGAEAPLVLFSSGGYGYSYFLDGRLRVGGGGQGTLASSSANGQSGSIGWGSVHVAWDPLAEGDWEFPFALSLGGGRVTLERAASGGLVSLQSSAFFAVQASASVEYRLVRTIKLALVVSWMAGIHGGGLQAQSLEGSLRLVFLLPRPGV